MCCVMKANQIMTMYAIYNPEIPNDFTIKRLDHLFNKITDQAKRLEIAAMLVSYKFRHIAITWVEGVPHYIRLLEEN
jgi:hypothetical protein